MGSGEFAASKEVNIMFTTLAWGMPGLPEWIIIGAIGLLLFGKRLPEVGRSLGKGIVEFKKGLKGIEDDIDEGVQRQQIEQPQRTALPADYKFDPQTGEPINREPAATVSRDSKPAYKFDPYTGQPISNS
jgi:sec-independent protein translocase protein TatA